jgi:hypothetical protein
MFAAQTGSMAEIEGAPAGSAAARLDELGKVTQEYARATESAPPAVLAFMAVWYALAAFLAWGRPPLAQYLALLGVSAWVALVAGFRRRRSQEPVVRVSEAWPDSWGRRWALRNICFCLGAALVIRSWGWRDQAFGPATMDAGLLVTAFLATCVRAQDVLRSNRDAGVGGAFALLALCSVGGTGRVEQWFMALSASFLVLLSALDGWDRMRARRRLLWRMTALREGST